MCFVNQVPRAEHRAGANGRAGVTEMSSSALTRFVVAAEPRIVRCHFTLRYPSDRNSNALGPLCEQKFVRQLASELAQ